MADLLWKPPAELTPGAGPVAAPSRLGRFLGLSAVAHLGVAALAPWLMAPAPPRAGEELVRPIDFFPSAEGEVGAAAAGPGRAAGPAPGRGRPAPAPAVARLVPAPAPAAPAAPSAPPQAAAPAVPAPPADTGELPLGTPKEVPSAESGSAASPPPRPTDVAPPSAVPAAVAPAAGPDSRLTALVRDLSPGSGSGPRATVSIPRELAGGGGGPGTGAGAGPAPGTGGGRAGPGPGTGGRAGGGRAGTVDAGDPDFTEYFRTIERQVRAVWQFPSQLQGTTQTVKLAFALRLDGTLEEARVLSSTSAVLDESAQSAMRRATPFPPLPMKFRALAGQPLVMSFTVTVR